MKKIVLTFCLWAALRSSKRSDHIRATVTGKLDRDSIHVDSIALD